MEKQIQKIERKLDKIDEGELRVFAGEFPESGTFILGILEKRRKILEKTQRKLIRLNEKNLINFKLS